MKPGAVLRRMAMPVALAAFALALPARPAGAQTPGPPSAGGTPAPIDTGPPERSLMEQVVPLAPCPAASGGPSRPMSAYTIDYDEGGFTAVSRKAIGTMTEMTFATVRWVVSVGMWMVSWAFSFGFADRLAAPMAAVADRYRSAFFLPLVGSALLISGAYAAIQLFRGQTGRGLGEFGLSLLLVGIFTTWLLADPKMFLDASLRFTAQLAGSMATVGLGDPPPGCIPAPGSYAVPRLDAAVQPLGAQIQRSFVEQPYELLEWGSPVPAACTAYRDAVLAAGPDADRTQLVDAMNRPGCSALYRFNRDPSTERLGVAVLVLLASGILMVSLGMVAGSVVMAQIVAVALIGAMPFAGLAAALPGASRAAMWWWATAMMRALGTIVVMSGFLTFLLLASEALLWSGQGQPLLVQMAVLNLVALVGIPLRHRLARSGRRAAAGIADRLAAAQPGVRGPPPAALPMITTARPEGHSFLEPPPDNALASRVASAVARARAAGPAAPSN